MKHILYVLILLVASSAFAQKIYTRNDSISITQDSVTIKVGQFRGNIQWQKSLDKKNWINLEGKTSDSLKIKPDTEAMYRAKVAEGTCLPVFSDSVAIIITDSIPKDYVNPSKTGLLLVSDSLHISEGNYIYTGTDTKSDFEIGKVIIDEQSGGTIRRITDIIKSSDTTSVKTQQATMEDLFIGTSFKLSTDMIQPVGLKSAKTNMDISKVLTDEDGFIHPYEITYRNENGLILKSAKADDPRQFGDNMHIKKDLGGQEFYKDGPARVYVSEGWVEFAPIFKFEFDFDRPNVDWNNLKINKGEIKKFKFWSEKSKFDFKTMITSEIAYSMNLEATRMLIPSVLNVSFTFMVGPVPVIIDATCDLMAHYDLEFDGSATVSTGFQATRYVTLGTSYENKQWTTWNDFTKADTFFPLEFTANLNFKQRAEIYPHFAIRLYKMIGPYFDVIPYLKAEENLDIINETWDASIDLGLDGRIGANIEVLGEELVGLPEKEFNMLNYNVFKAPAQIEAVSGNDQEGKSGELLPLPIKIKVTNSLSKTLSAFPVFFSTTNGSVDNLKVLTDHDGIATVNWTLDPTDGTKILRAYLKDGNGEDRSDCELDITATVPTILPGSAPISDFTISSTLITKGQSVQFTDKSIYNPTSWYWTFGDGTTSTEQNPTKIFNSSGDFMVALKVTNSFGYNIQTSANSITVTESGTGPVADFSISPISIMGQSVQFTDNSANTPTSWLWDFGDGTTSTEQNPSKTYNTTGIYTVSLKATNSYGNNTYTTTISVSEPVQNDDISQGLVLYLSCDGNANDMSGNNNNGTVSGATLVADRKGNSNSAYQFGGYYNSNYIKVNNSSSLQFSNTFTFSVWVKINNKGGMDGWGNYSNTASQHILFAKDFDYGGRAHALINFSPQCNTAIVAGSGIGTNINYTEGNWVHLAYVSNGSQLKIYQNGTLLITESGALNFATSNSQDLYFGRFADYWYPLDGMLDDMRMYNRALTDSEIQKLYQL